MWWQGDAAERAGEAGFEIDCGGRAVLLLFSFHPQRIEYYTALPPCQIATLVAFAFVRYRLLTQCTFSALILDHICLPFRGSQ